MNAHFSAPRRTLSRIIPLKLTCLAILAVLFLAASAAAQNIKPDVTGGPGWVAPEIGLMSSGSPSGYGSSVTFTASIVPLTCASNTVAQFYDGGTWIGSAHWGTGTLVMGKATFSTIALAVGTHTITAHFGGSVVGTTTCRAENSNPVTQVIGQGSPTITAWPTASAITFGQTLASSTLSGGTASAAGTFAWTAPDTIPPAGTQSESVTFTPSDTATYATVTGSTSLGVIVLNFSSPTINSNIQVVNGGGPALVPLGNGLYTNALELIYVNISQDVAMAYSTDGLHYTNSSPDGRLVVPYGYGVAEVDCTPAYPDNCGVAAAYYNNQLYVAYSDISCGCLYVLAGTAISGRPDFSWTLLHTEPAYQLVSTPAMLVTMDNSADPKLIIRYGTTIGNDDAYSTVYDIKSGTWTTQASNGSSPTQSTLFTVNQSPINPISGVNYWRNYAIDRSADGKELVYITQLDDNGVALPGTTYQLQYVQAALGFSSTVYNSAYGPLMFVASAHVDNNNLDNVLQVLAAASFFTTAALRLGECGVTSPSRIFR